MKQILMTSPTKFGVQYQINPWMDGNIGAINTNLAVQQWSNLRNELIDLGVDVVVLPEPPDDCPDAVFTANAGSTWGNTFVPSRFKHHERRPEEDYFIKWFKEHKYNVVPLVPLDREADSFEGAGDFLLGDKQFWLGTGFRTTPYYHSLLEDTIPDHTIRVVKLVDPRFYHLDTCFCPLDNGFLLWYPGAFSEASQHKIREAYHGAHIEVSEDDAVAFACNSVSVGTYLVTPIISAGLVADLIEIGVVARQVDLSEFKKSGGSAKCLTLEVHK